MLGVVVTPADNDDVISSATETLKFPCDVTWDDRLVVISSVREMLAVV